LWFSGQADPALMAEKEAITGISTEQRRAARANIPMPTILKGADVGISSEYIGTGGKWER
jgi:hypothetical protein